MNDPASHEPERMAACASWNQFEKWGDIRMPYYSFDLVLGEEYKNQGGLILEDVKLAADRADQLAIELAIVHPELKAKGCSVRVTNADDTEVYRRPLDPIPSWVRRQD
ncbi:hypothetical protein [Bradyrhizobium sp. RDM4]|uniref:hypothetical protein n=1 Tax=Bradyrhizobium sp. RDM4 TaxID=3378765 RepID=UPI0038FC5931